MNNSHNNWVLVTGAGKRIGRAVAEWLGAHGWGVILHYANSKAGAEEAADHIRLSGGMAHTIAADLANSSAAEALVGRAADMAGASLAAVVNNASIYEEDHFGTATAVNFEQHMAINTLAPLLITQAFASACKAANQEGCVVNIVDQRVLHPGSDFTSYTLSKSALWTLTRTSAQALAPLVRVNAIGPGPVLASQYQSAEDFATEAANTPLGRGPSLNEIGETIAWILGTRSMTGQMVTLDGGQHLL